MDKNELIDHLNELIAKRELLIFNPKTTDLVDDGIESIVLNGSAIQITLSEDAVRASHEPSGLQQSLST